MMSNAESPPPLFPTSKNSSQAQPLTGTAATHSTNAALQHPTLLVEGVRKIALEGNIAAGKSTFLQILAESFDVSIVPEPVSRWKNMSETSDIVTAAAASQQNNEDDNENGPSVPCSQHTGGNLLSLFYADPPRWAYTFQTYAFLSRIRAQLRTPDKPHPKTQYFSKSSNGNRSDDNTSNGSALNGSNKRASETDSEESAVQRVRIDSEDEPAQLQFMERSVFSDCYCFGVNCLESNLFSALEWQMYREWHDYMLDTIGARLNLSGIIYLRTSPKKCYERLQRRAREEEATVKLEYLESLHQRHEEWLVEKKPSLNIHPSLHSIPVLIIESDLEFETDPVRCREMLETVKAFLKI